MRRSIVFLICLVILLVASYGWFWYKYIQTSQTPEEVVTKEPDVTWRRYTNNQVGLSFEVPGNWQQKPTESMTNNIEQRIVFQSPDFKSNIDTTAENFPPIKIDSGYELALWVQEPSNIKTFEELKHFYTLGSEGHLVKKEETVTVYRTPALFHELGDYESGLLLDVHMLYGDRWVTLTFSARADDPEARQTFERILASFVAEEQSAQ